MWREREGERARAREGKQYVKIKLVNTAKQPNKAPITWCVLVNARARAKQKNAATVAGLKTCNVQPMALTERKPAWRGLSSCNSIYCTLSIPKDCRGQSLWCLGLLVCFQGKAHHAPDAGTAKQRCQKNSCSNAQQATIEGEGERERLLRASRMQKENLLRSVNRS